MGVNTLSANVNLLDNSSMNCKYCHVALGYSRKPRTTGACRSCKHKHYRERDPEKYKDYCRKMYSAIPKEHRLAVSRAWREKNPDLVHAKDVRSRQSLSGQFKHGVYKAKRFNQSWEITKEFYAELRSKPCVYCGSKLNRTGSGLDRKDCSIGYTVENVVPCCGPCNRIKRELLTYEEMKVAMAAVVSFRKNLTIS